MALLLLVSFIWAFSFSLIKGRLVGVDSTVISAVRLGLALLIFLPLLRWRDLAARAVGALMAIGAVQFGVMYLAYNESFRYLEAYEVALFTITTPILVTLFADALGRTFRLRALLAALLAIAGAAAVVVQSRALHATLVGFALVQVSNAAFAIGQVLYKRVRLEAPVLNLPDRALFAWVYVGAFAVAVIAMLLRVDVATLVLTRSQVWTLLYLGVVASGLGFFLWNVGATQVTAGTLAVMNNAKVPLSVACSLLFFGERANGPGLIVSLGLMTIAVLVAGTRPKASADNS